MHVLLAILTLVASMTGHGEPDIDRVSPEDLVRAPVTQEAYSWDLQELGYQNGRMPAIRLIRVGDCLLERDAAYTMSQMIETAALDGVTLDPAWCYRTIPEQRQTYARNCPVTPIVEAVTDPVTGLPVVDEALEPVVIERGSERVCSVPTASPSRSNHGWGRAVDFEVGGAAMGCGHAAFRWLQENAGDFGWIHPDWAQCNKPTREPWHWEYGGLQLLPFPSLLEPPSVEPPANME